MGAELLPKCCSRCHTEAMDRPGRYYTMTALERDRVIRDLKRRGVTNKRIGQQVGMTESGVRRAWERISNGGFGEGMTRM
jgi:DNA-binding NarL/FixJ family response regulator